MQAPIVPEDLEREVLAAALLGLYVLLVVAGGLPLYRLLRRRYPHNAAIYFVRKYIHIAGGGVVALLVPNMFTSPLLPALMGLGFAAFLSATRRLKPLYWFQTGENAYEVNFTIAWGLGILILWVITGDPRTAVLPALLIAFGDGITGIVRNMIFQRRTKHWAGNLAMLPIALLLGWTYAGPPGLLAGLVASIVEKYEAPPLDDNALIVIASTIVLLLA